MLYIENDFLTRYKSVDAVCRDMLRGEHYYNNEGEEVYGLSAYIRVLESEDASVRAQFPEWDGQYEILKRLTTVRAQIAQDAGVSDCEESDVAALDHFYRQLIDRTDLLASVYRWKETWAQGEKEPLIPQYDVPKAPPHAPPVGLVPPDPDVNWKMRLLLGILGVAVAILVATFMVLVLFE